MTPKQIAEKYFGGEYFPDIYLKISDTVEDSSSLSDYELQRIIVDCQSLMAKYLQLLAFVMQGYRKLDDDYNRAILTAVHESLFSVLRSYYGHLQTLIGGYVQESQNPEEFWQSLILRKALNGNDIGLLQLPFHHGASGIVSALAKRTLKLKVFVDEENTFEIYNDALDRGIDLPEYTLGENGMISSQRYFFNELLLLLQSTEVFYKAFKDDGSPDDSSTIDNDGMMNVPGIEIVSGYAGEFMSHLLSYNKEPLQ